MSQVERVDRAGAQKYLGKAEQHLRAAEAAAAKEDWDATALCAIHAAISAADAYLSSVFGQRSTSKDHLDVVRLLRRLGGKSVASQASALQRLLVNKTTVAYEDRLTTTRDAHDSLVRARRLVAWATETLTRS